MSTGFLSPGFVYSTPLSSGHVVHSSQHYAATNATLAIEILFLSFCSKVRLFLEEPDCLILYNVVGFLNRTSFKVRATRLLE